MGALATSTPGANKVVQALPTSKIDTGWLDLPAIVAGIFVDSIFAVTDNADPTKRLNVQAGTQATGATLTLDVGAQAASRVASVPVLAGNDTFAMLGVANVFTQAISATNLSGTNTGDQTITLTSDVTGTGTGSFATTIAAGAVTLAKQANLAANSIIGNNTGAPATPLALTGTQVTAMLDAFTAGLQGLAPASGGGTANYLRADGTWASPPGATSGTVTSVAMSVPAFLSVSGSPITTSGTLAVSLSGTALPVDNGGTGAVTLTGIVKGNGTSAFTAAVSGTDYVPPGAITSSSLTMATARILGRTTAATGAVEEITVGSGLTLSAGSLTGNLGTVTSVGVSSTDLSVSGSPITTSGTITLDVNAGAITLAKMANLAANSIIGNNTGGAATPLALTTAQVKTMLDLTGTNSGDQTITLTSDVTGSGTGSFATTIANDAVTNAKLANVATQTFKGRTTAGTGDPEDLTVAQAKTMLNLTGTNSGDVTLGAIGSSANANGATLAGQVLNLEPASASFGGIVTVGTQTIAGAKTLSGITTISNATASTTSTDGALVVTGGAGIGGRINVGDTTEATAYNAASVELAGGLGLAKNLWLGAGTGTRSIVIDGGNTNASDGALVLVRNNGTDIFAVGNYSSLYGGAYNAAPHVFTTTPLNFSQGIRCLSASSALGYDTGAGGTVTQATSRTTGVTLNKTCGAITLFSAANSTTFRSFTVTNSTVSATDVIIMSQKSGTDRHRIHVTNVGAGTFEVTYATTTGTTNEAPVFNFAVVNAVTA